MWRIENLPLPEVWKQRVSMMNTEPSLKPNPKLRWYQPKKCTDQNGTHGLRTRDLSTGATGALSIELIPSFHRANLPGFDNYTGPIGGALFRSTTDDMNDVKVILAKK
jgi:hypothetical protein